MSNMVNIKNIDQFRLSANINRSFINNTVQYNISILAENIIVKWLSEIVAAPDRTPHGPTEIADIYTNNITLNGETCTAAFVVKGKAWPKVKARDVTHQIVKLKQIPDLKLVILVAVGDIQDDTKRDFFSIALDSGWNCMIIDKIDLARILITHKKICPIDGFSFDNEICPNGHQLNQKTRIEIIVNEEPEYLEVSTRDFSYSGAKRTKATIIIERHHTDETIRELIKDAIKHYRCHPDNTSVATSKFWGDSPVHVVSLLIGRNIEDVVNYNWYCRAEWVDPNLPERNGRVSSSHEEFDGINIWWNDVYDKLRRFYKQIPVDKCKLVAMIRSVKGRCKEILEDVINSFARYAGKNINEDEFISLIIIYADEAEQLYDDTNNRAKPPIDCVDLDNLFEAFLQSFMNMWIYHTSEVFLKRDTDNRMWLFENTLHETIAALKKLEIEEEKMGVQSE